MRGCGGRRYTGGGERRSPGGSRPPGGRRGGRAGGGLPVFKSSVPSHGLRLRIQEQLLYTKEPRARRGRTDGRPAGAPQPPRRVWGGGAQRGAAAVPPGERGRRWVQQGCAGRARSAEGAGAALAALPGRSGRARAPPRRRPSRRPPAAAPGGRCGAAPLLAGLGRPMAAPAPRRAQVRNFPRGPTRCPRLVSVQCTLSIGTAASRGGGGRRGRLS